MLFKGEIHLMYYSAIVLITKKNSFITSTPGPNFIKHLKHIICEVL